MRRSEPIRAAILACLDWLPAIDSDRKLRNGAEIAELTHLVDLSAYPPGTRMIVRRERPHPGAQLSLFDTIEGLRHQVFLTDSPRSACSVQLLELRHRAHARVEDRIRTGKDSGFGRFPSRQFGINQAWLELALVGVDLLAWTRTLLLDGEHALAERKKLSYRLLHVAARVVRTARRTILRIAQTWPWADELAAAYARLAALPRCPNRSLDPSHPHHLQGTLEHARHRARHPSMPPSRNPPTRQNEDQKRPTYSPTE